MDFDEHFDEFVSTYLLDLDKRNHYRALSPRQCYHHKCAILFSSLRHMSLSTQRMLTNHRKLMRKTNSVNFNF